jgi:hypothetical protein
LVKIVGALDRYHGLERRSRTALPAPYFEAPEPLPAAPLALTYSAPLDAATNRLTSPVFLRGRGRAASSPGAAGHRSGDCSYT